MSEYATGRFADISWDEGQQISSHLQAARIVERMLLDLEAHPHEWENRSLGDFLEALAACLADDDDYSAPPSWSLFARAIVTASGYE